MRYYLAAAAALALQVSAAHADTAIALVGNDVLVTIDTQTSKTKGWTKIEGIGPVLGIDVRPADGKLYALAADGTIAILDPVSGQATPKSKLDMTLSADFKLSVDFNPVADRLRVVGRDGSNLRINVDDGKVIQDQPLKFAANDAADGQTPAVVAVAYTNSVKGAKETALYDIDVDQGSLLKQAPPNDGVLKTIGMLGLEPKNIGFDIVKDASGADVGMLTSQGNLYTVDIATGKALAGKKIAGLPTDVRDIAVLPAQEVVNANAAMMKADGVQMNATSQTGIGYMPKPTQDMKGGNQPKAMSQMKPASDMKSGNMKKPAYRAGMQMQYDDDYVAKPKRRGPQCNDGAQY